MIRTVPHGLSVGQTIVPLVDSEMTNGKIASANVRYEIRVIYPGGAIIRSADEILSPGGLIKAGTPVHVEGEPDPTDEELARLVDGGVLPGSLLSRDVSDAADFSGSSGAWDYRADPARRVRAPRQASLICDIIVDSGKREFLEADLLRLITEQGARLNTKQDPTQVFRYYRKHLVASGFLSTRR